MFLFKIFSILIHIFFIIIVFVYAIDSKCLQKNTKREANRDQYICRNQYFEPGAKIADPENCECYYHCNFKQQPCYECCPNGFVFKPKQNECVLASAFKCENKPKKFICQGRGLFMNKDHCRKYWDCRDETNLLDEPIEEACPDDHHWDDRHKICRKDSEVLNIEDKCKDN